MADNILAIDPSTKCGWSLRYGEDQRIVYGTWKLGEGERPGVYFLQLGRLITALRREYGIEDQPLQIVIENKALNATGTQETKHLAESWLAVVEIYAEAKNLPPPIAVGVNSWRSAYIGRSMAPKEVKGDAERRKWIKAATVAECRRRGLEPADDNQADSLGILFWFLVGGPVVLEQRRADKKARTKAKRAQKKFLFDKAAA